MADRLLLQGGDVLLLQGGDSLLLQGSGAAAVVTPGPYREGDAMRMIILVSDDAGVTWRPRGRPA